MSKSCHDTNAGEANVTPPLAGQPRTRYRLRRAGGARYQGVRYPVSKTELVEYARRHNADEDVIGRIEMLPGDRYAVEADVATAFSRSRTAHTNPRTL